MWVMRVIWGIQTLRQEIRAESQEFPLHQASLGNADANESVSAVRGTEP